MITNYTNETFANSRTVDKGGSMMSVGTISNIMSMYGFDPEREAEG